MGMAGPTDSAPDMVRATPDDGNGYDDVCDELLVAPASRLGRNC